MIYHNVTKLLFFFCLCSEYLNCVKFQQDFFFKIHNCLYFVEILLYLSHFIINNSFLFFLFYPSLICVMSVANNVNC